MKKILRSAHGLRGQIKIPDDKAFKDNNGWRLDYFLISERLTEKVIASTIERGIFGGRHCPITLTLK
ncbi:MAG: hypothetical protein IJS69_02940 [Selenomonadaceae bacterium]|nr:hypothetical protein [Selenomonadaceae bacterium]